MIDVMRRHGRLFTMFVVSALMACGLLFTACAPKADAAIFAYPAASATYSQVNIGTGDQPALDDGSVVSVAYGKDYGKLRFDVNATQSRDFGSGFSENTSFLVGLDGYYDVFKVEKATAFVGVGAAYGPVTTNFDSHYGLVYRASLGVDYPLTDNLLVEGKYQYQRANDFNLGDRQYQQNTYSVGLRYVF